MSLLERSLRNFASLSLLVVVCADRCLLECSVIGGKEFEFGKLLF